MVSAGGKVFASDINAVINGSTKRPLCILRKATITTVANNGAALLWDTEDVDTDGWHSTSSNTSRITPTKAGWVELSGCIGWAVGANTTTRRGIAVDFNGGSRRYGTMAVPSATASQNVYVTSSWILSFNGTTDYAELIAYQNSGGNLDTVDVLATTFRAKWLRDL